MALIECQRALFDIPEGVAYFDCAKMSPLSRAAIEVDHRAAGLQGAVGTEVRASGHAGAVHRVELGGEDPLLVAASSVEGALDVPVGRRGECHPLALPVDHEASRDRLHAPGAQAAPDLFPKQRTELVTDQAVQDPLWSAIMMQDRIGPNRTGPAGGVSAALGDLHRPSPTEAVAVLRARVADFAYGTLTDDLCLLAARIT